MEPSSEWSRASANHDIDLEQALAQILCGREGTVVGTIPIQKQSSYICVPFGSCLQLPPALLPWPRFTFSQKQKNSQKQQPWTSCKTSKKCWRRCACAPTSSFKSPEPSLHSTRHRLSQVLLWILGFFQRALRVIRDLIKVVRGFLGFLGFLGLLG